MQGVWSYIRSAAQVSLYDGVRAGKLGAGAAEDDLTGFQNVGPVCDLQSLTGVLFHQEDGGAILVKLLNDIKDLVHQDGSQTHGGFVQHHELRMAHQCPGHGQHLLLAAGQGAGYLLAALLQPGEICKQVAGTLSGGEQQMLAMSRALMSHPKLMMLDEPSMGLAPILVDQIFDIIKELHKEGTTILLVEQNARKALQIADRAYVLETGNITLSGTGAELASSDAVKKAYLGG